MRIALPAGLVDRLQRRARKLELAAGLEADGPLAGWLDQSDDAPVVDDQREPLDQRQSDDVHGRQTKRVGQLQVLIRQHRKRQMKSRGHFGLVGVVLGGETENMRSSRRLQFGEEIAEGARLRRTTPRTRDHVPIVDQRDLAGLAGARIGENHAAPGKRREGHHGVVGRRHVAHRGVFQLMLTTTRIAQLLRLTVPREMACVPEISANRLMVSVRLLRPNEAGGLQVTTENAAFELTLCA